MRSILVHSGDKIALAFAPLGERASLFVNGVAVARLTPSDVAALRDDLTRELVDHNEKKRAEATR